ncbi:MAG: putative alcohol dehydrogenase AdhA [Chlamydiae bacterium]|nr:putative alcohol dehydrogenase AdhA [Chlamydiota bacterium]
MGILKISIYWDNWQYVIMRAMVLEKPHEELKLRDLPIPTIENDQILIKVKTCGICRTDLHILDGELTEPKLPLVPGHQVVGIVEKLGSQVTSFQVGDRIGIPWLWKSCGECKYCQKGLENLCNRAIYTGYQVNGGFAEYCVANESFGFAIPEDYSDLQAAPLMCAGLIGYRSYKMTQDAKKIGFYGFGAAAHILTQVAVYQGKEVYAFTRPGDEKTQQFAKNMGAVWAGGSDEKPPETLDAAIIFAPIGPLVPAALKVVDKGGVVVCAGIHMSDIPEFPYRDLWEERMIRSVSNLTRNDAEEFLALAPKVPIKSEVTVYELEQANQALDDLRHGRFSGAAVIVI